MIDLAIKLLAGYTIVVMMVVIATSIWQVGETSEHSRTGAVINFIALSFVIIFAILVLLKGKF